MRTTCLGQLSIGVLYSNISSFHINTHSASLIHLIFLFRFLANMLSVVSFNIISTLYYILQYNMVIALGILGILCIPFKVGACGLIIQTFFLRAPPMKLILLHNKKINLPTLFRYCTSLWIFCLKQRHAIPSSMLPPYGSGSLNYSGPLILLLRFI